ncbi:MAG: hypothetical protein JST10_09245, partial [Bacteroidetes bacterium]|nr:hypothetical protein [Bacteroidota bacterium]
MYNELYQIFILDKELKIPGIGNFILTRKPAEANFLEKAINPPVYSISLDKETGVPVKSFYSGLAGLLHTDDKEATTRFNDFVSDLKQKFMAGKKIEWPGIGILTAGSKGTITFQPFG